MGAVWHGVAGCHPWACSAAHTHAHSSVPLHGLVCSLTFRTPPCLPPPLRAADFKQAFDHFCLHAGGRGVVEGLSKQLGLPTDKVAPSANTLHWWAP